MNLVNLSTGGLIGIILGISIPVIVATILFVIYFAIPHHYKKVVRTLEKRYSFLDAKLIGQDSQYINRIEIISRTNLLYLDKHEMFSRRFKIIFETEDKYSESMLKQLRALINAKQFKRIKSVISETKKSLDVFEESVKSLDEDLYAVIKLEEDCRRQMDYSKELYRHIKQTYYAESNDLEIIANTFNKMFDKIDATFSKMDDQIEGAEYDEINAKIPEINSVLDALGKVLIEAPTLCSLVKTVVSEKIIELQNKFREIEKQGIPLYHLGFKAHVDDWKKRQSDLTKKLINLQTAGIHAECDLIISEIGTLSNQLDEEVVAKSYFKENYEIIYRDVNDIQKEFIKIFSLLPQVEAVYLISQEEKDKINELSKSVTNLGNAKRYLDGFVLSGTKQPYSLLKNQLDLLKENYDVVAEGVNNFKNYIDSLKTTAEEAYKMIYVYYYRMKEIEKVLADIGIDSLKESYQEKIDAAYEILNFLYTQISSKPINVDEVTNKIEQLKNISNALFEEIDEHARLSDLVEQDIVLLNAKISERDIAQEIEQIEGLFNDALFSEAHQRSENLKLRLESSNNE